MPRFSSVRVSHRGDGRVWEPAGGSQSEEEDSAPATPIHTPIALALLEIGLQMTSRRVTNTVLSMPFAGNL